MRTLFVFLSVTVGAVAQPVSFGVRGGVPLTDFVSVVSSGRINFNTTTNRYIIGPTVELRLPFGLGFEFDALYRRLHYDSSALGVDTFSTSKTTGNRWEFPLLLKYRLPTRVVRPYVAAGISWDTLTGLKQSVTTTVFPTRVTSTTATSNPPELNQKTTVGFVVGVGLDIHVLLHISPEIRYTRWNSQQLRDQFGLLDSSQNQAEFLLGITF